MPKSKSVKEERPKGLPKFLKLPKPKRKMKPRGDNMPPEMKRVKGQRIGGRQKGTRNKITREAKTMIALAAEGIGGLPRLIRWAKRNNKNETVFWSQIYSRLIPHKITEEEAKRDVISAADIRTRFLDIVARAVEARRPGDGAKLITDVGSRGTNEIVELPGETRPAAARRSAKRSNAEEAQ